MQQDFDTLYTETIMAQREHLAQLQQTFNKHCDTITAETKEKLKKPENEDKEAQTKIHEEQKTKLNDALNNLRTAIDESARQTRKKLEEINTAREKSKIDKLDKMLDTA